MTSCSNNSHTDKQNSLSKNSDSWFQLPTRVVGSYKGCWKLGGKNIKMTEFYKMHPENYTDMISAIVSEVNVS